MSNGVILDAGASRKHTPRRDASREHTVNELGPHFPNADTHVTEMRKVRGAVSGGAEEEGRRQGNKREFVRKYAEEKLRAAAIINLDEAKQAFRIIRTTAAARMFATYCRNIRHLFRVFQNVRIRVDACCVYEVHDCASAVYRDESSPIFSNGGRRLDLGRSRPPMNGL